MNRLNRQVALLGLILVLAAALLYPLVGQAAPLSAGATTYVIDGEEVLFPYDPITRKEGVLLPLEVFHHLGAQVAGALEQSFTLTAGPVTASLTLGRQAALIDGATRRLAVAPVRLNGRLFLPADLVEALGVSFSQEGSYVTLQRHAARMIPLRDLPDADWAALEGSRGFTAQVKSDGGTYLPATFHLLNEEMLAAGNLRLDWGTRARLAGLLETNSLLLVKLSNTGPRSGSLQTAGIMLVDSQRSQYEVSQVIDIGQGLLTGKLAPGADRTGVLVLPKLPAAISSVSLYYDPNGAVLGTFNR